MVTTNAFAAFRGSVFCLGVPDRFVGLPTNICPLTQKLARGTSLPTKTSLAKHREAAVAFICPRSLGWKITVVCI